MTARLVRDQGVTAAAGFRAAGIAAGIKKSGAPDLALVFNEGPDYSAAAVFTRNQVKAAPVLWTSQAITTGRLRAVLLNSGGANACTGPGGFQDTHATAEAVATPKPPTAPSQVFLGLITGDIRFLPRSIPVKKAPMSPHLGTKIARAKQTLPWMAWFSA